MGKRDVIATTITTVVTKKMKVDPITTKCDLVSAAIVKLADLPVTTCDMLKMTLPLSLGVCQNERHQYQQSNVEVVAKELSKIEAKHQSKVNEEEVAVGSIEQDKQLHESTVIELKTTLGTKKDMLHENKLKLCEEATAFRNAKLALKGAEERKEIREKELAEIECKIVDLEDICQNTFQSLKEGSVEQTEATKLASELIARVQKLFSLNETLATTIPSALGKEPAARGPFDTLAIQHLEENFEKCLTEWKAFNRDAEAVKAEHAAEVHTALEAFKLAQERQIASAETFTTSRKEMEETEQLLMEAKKNLERMPAAQQKAKKKLQNAQNELNAFRQGPLSIFAELCDRNQLEIENNNSNVDTNEIVKSEAEVPIMLPTA